MSRKKKCKYHTFRSEKYDLLRLLNMPWSERSAQIVREKCMYCDLTQESLFSYEHERQAHLASECEICETQHLHIDESIQGCIRSLAKELRHARDEIDSLKQERD